TCGRPVWIGLPLSWSGARGASSAAERNKETEMQGLRPHLGFNEKGEEAINFYCSLIPNSRVIDVQRYGEGGPLPAGSLMWATFKLDGREFSAFDGGPPVKFPDTYSMFLTSDPAAESDPLWHARSGGGEEGQCGWIKDAVGLSWQVVPPALAEMMAHPEAGDTGRMMQALLEMRNLDIAALRAAYEGATVG